MRTVIIGAGGVGGYFGALLASAGHEVAFLARGAHLDALRTRGLRVSSPDGDMAVTGVRASDSTAELGTADVVLLCVKTWQLDAVLPHLKPLIGPDTAVVTTQNGVEAPDAVAAAVGREHVLPGVARVIARIDGPGVIAHVGGGVLTFAEWDGGSSPRAEALREAVGARASVSPGIWSELWAKFAFIAPTGGLGAVTGAAFGELRDDPDTRRVLADGYAEVGAVAAAHGVDLGDVAASTLAFLDAQPEQGTTSLQRDIIAGLPSELDAWTGAVVRLGEAKDVPTPVNRVLWSVLK
ncbi:2-dehydropantoate 2-reductase [Actinorhabdospora filicis]|uniref:2-dehydropantoate 2-reductase n=1 Tax=Actinorhabdospora filicis TaxID=1785913 RepID=A0A9W6SSW9_9ACTN|nr:2-dehydropantoate 2-reductase [Actinorhabdospora filicis]GLZ80156.1 2-dehydropantoate 2-reductase [Actinorhabdospora filicis]